MAMAHETPLVTVCVPVYEGAQFVAETLQSILAQTHRALRVIVSVDPGGDDSVAVCRRFERDARVEVLEQPRRLGWVDNFNFLLDRVETDYCCVIPHDDLLAARYVETLLEPLHRTPGAICSYGDLECFGDQPMAVAQPALRGTRLQRTIEFLSVHMAAAAVRGLIACTRMGSPPKLRHNGAGDFAADTVWMLELARAGELIRDGTVLYRKRLHGGSEIQRWMRRTREQKAAGWVEHCVQCALLALDGVEDAAERAMIMIAARARLMQQVARFPGVIDAQSLAGPTLEAMVNEFNARTAIPNRLPPAAAFLDRAEMAPYFRARSFDQEVLARLPVTARSVLEVRGEASDSGDGDGALGWAFLSRQPRVAWHSVDAAELERDPAAPGLAPASVDAVVFGGRLSDLADPAAILARLAPLLREGGVAIARLHGAATDLSRLRVPGFALFDSLPRRDKSGAVVSQVVRAIRGRLPALMEVRQMIFAGRFLDVRTVEPGALLGSLPGMRVQTRDRAMRIVQPKDATPRIFVIHRTLPDDPQAYLRGVADLLAAGYVVVADMDDHPERFPGPLRERALAAAPVVLGGCHAIQASTAPLAAELRAWNREVGVVPNQLFELPPVPERPLEPVRLFFGAINREDDWAPHMASLNRILATRPGVRVRVVYDRAFFDALETPNKAYFPALPRLQYLAALHACHVAWLPLADTLGNRCKSDIKALECAAGAVAILASETVYARSLRHGDTAWLYAEGTGFAHGLESLLDQAALRARLGEAARAWVAAERMGCDHVESRREWYAALWSRRAALTEALYARLPQLRRAAAGKR